MALTITGEAAETARARAENLGLDPVAYLERLVAAEAGGEALVTELLCEAMDDPEEPWDVEAIRHDGRALAERMRRA